MAKLMSRSQIKICPALEQFKMLIHQKQNLNTSYITEQLLIQKQTQLITQIMNSSVKSPKHKTHCDEISNFSLSTIENSNILSPSKSTTELYKQQFKQGINFFLDEALKQIRKNCSSSTYRLVRQKFRSTDQTHLQSRLQKEVRHNKQLIKNCLKYTQNRHRLSHEVSELKSKLETAGQKIKTLQKSSKESTKQKSMNLQKNELFLKWQKSMLHKQKIQGEVKKYLNRQFEVLEQQKKINQIIRDQIYGFVQRMEKNAGVNHFKQFVNQVKGNISQQKKLNEKQRSQFVNAQNQLEQIFKELRNILNFRK